MFRNENDPAGFAVEAIDQRKLAAAGELVGAEGFEAVEKSGRISRNGRMDKKMRRFVDEKKVGVLVDDGKFGRVEAEVDKRSLPFIFVLFLNLISRERAETEIKMEIRMKRSYRFFPTADWNFTTAFAIESTMR